MSKYLFDESEISKELIILLATFNASKTNHELLNPIANSGGLLTIFYTEWGIIQDNLIATAIKLRIIDDQFKKHFIKPVFLYDNIVGQLTKGKNEPQSLYFREACNKIIHAIKFLPNTSPKNKPERDQHYLPKIDIEGTQGKIKWKAVIDIKKYVCNGLSLIKQYDENWDISCR